MSLIKAQNDWGGRAPLWFSARSAFTRSQGVYRDKIVGFQNQSR